MATCSRCRKRHDGAYWWADYCSRGCRLEDTPRQGAVTDIRLVPDASPTADRVCAGFDCSESLDGKRWGAIYHSRACAMRTKRYGAIPRDWPMRARTFWNGVEALRMAAIANRGLTG